MEIRTYKIDMGQFNGQQITIESKWEKDGDCITLPSSNPTGGCRQQITTDGNWDIAVTRAMLTEFPFWVGGGGYKRTPRRITLLRLRTEKGDRP